MTLPTMRILLVYTGIHPDHIGGVEKRNHDLARELTARGHDVTLAGFVEDPRRLPSGIPTLSLGGYKRLYSNSGRRSTWEALRYGRRVSKIDLSQFDVVETASVPLTHLRGLWGRARRHEVPLVVSWYEFWDGYWQQYLLAPLAQLARRRERHAAQTFGHRLVCTSRLTADRIREAVARTPDVIPVGVDTHAVAARAATAVPGSAILGVGRLIPEKRFDLAIRALHRLRSMHDVTLRIVGDGPHRVRLQSLAAALGVGAAIDWVTEIQTDEEMWCHLGSARLLIHPSAREGFGIVAIEAMAAGLPVVACESPENAMTELIEDGVTGYVTAAAPEAIATAVERLLRNDDHRARIGAQARNHAGEYAWSHIATRYEDLLRALVGSRTIDPPSAAH